MFHVIRVFLSRLLHRDRFERDLHDEIRFHLEVRAADLERSGLTADEARRRATLEFGGIQKTKEQLRSDRPGAGLDALAQDLRLSVRRLRREPAFAITVALTLSLGIGAATAVFGVLSTTLLSRIPYREPDRLVVGQKSFRSQANAGPVSAADYIDYRAQSRSFDELAALQDFIGSRIVTGGQEPWEATSTRVTWNLLRTLGVEPALGRSFLPEEEAQADAQVAIISYQLWQNRFGGRPDVLERTLVVEGSPLQIVGVLPKTFRFIRDVDVWRVMRRSAEARNSHSYYLVGRMRAGVSQAQAQRDVDAISRALEREYPESNKDKGLGLISLQQFLGGDLRMGLLLPAAAAVCLLLIACANVAGLLLARGQRRQQEVAMRAALGASRWRLVRQLLTESVVLTVPAGMAGIGVAYLLQGMLLRLLPVSTVGVSRPVLDGTVLLFALGASVVTGLVVGVVPALRGAAVSLTPHLGTGRQACERPGGSRLRSGLVVAQIAISVVLLVGSGLVVRSLQRLSAVDFGFSAEHLLAAQFKLPLRTYQKDSLSQAFYASVREQVGALPGVKSVAFVNQVPILDRGAIWGARASELSVTAEYDWMPMRVVSAGYFATMGIPIVAGRDFSDADREGAPAVAVISQSLARKFFGDRDPVGRSFLFYNNFNYQEVPYEVIGVARDARIMNPRAASNPTVYLSMLQPSPVGGRSSLVVRTAGEVQGLARSISAIVRRLEPNALVSVRTMDDVIDESFAGLRRTTLYLGLFAGLALLLAAVGLYGALAYHVSQTEHEIGVRVAIGATRGDILGMVLQRGVLLVVIGLGLGVAVAYPGTRLVRSLLYETAPLDPATYLLATLLLGAVAGVACLVPALRAMRIEPMVALRSE